MSLEGLGKKLSNDEALRAKILKDGSIISWPSPKHVGICSNPDAQRLNSHLLKIVADLWCPQWDSPSMIPIDEVKAQAWS